MICERTVKKFCYEPKMIENYYKAISDTENMWDCHHRVETIMNCGKKELIAVGAYYDRPAHDLIFLPHGEHRRLHNRGNNYSLGKKRSEETKKKISDAKKGEKHPNFGKHHSEETRSKMSEAQKGDKSYWFGKKHSDETRMKIAKSMKGRKFSEETRRKMSESAKRNWASRK